MFTHSRRILHAPKFFVVARFRVINLCPIQIVAPSNLIVLSSRKNWRRRRRKNATITVTSKQKTAIEIEKVQRSHVCIVPSSTRFLSASSLLPFHFPQWREEISPYLDRSQSCLPSIETQRLHSLCSVSRIIKKMPISNDVSERPDHSCSISR